MQRIQTPISGVSINSNYTEGECISLVNLRYKHGSLHPVAPRKVMQTLSRKYDIIVVHKNSGYENWIGVTISSGSSSVYNNIRNSGSAELIQTIPDVISSVQQIGNTLSLISDSNIYYMFYKDKSYKFLGKLPDLLPIKFSTTPFAETENHLVEVKYNELYPENSINKENFENATLGLVAEAYRRFKSNSGIHLYDAHFIRYAYRLFDGSLIKHSPPILLMPEKVYSQMKILNATTDHNYVLSDSFVQVYGYKTFLNYNYESLTDWKDIITSIDIFLSPPIGASPDGYIKPLILFPGSETLVSLTGAMRPEAIANAKNNSTFYFVKALQNGSSSLGDEFPANKEDEANLENLLYQELMSLDSFSHHAYGAKTSLVYNNRLHLANTQTLFFNGFKPEFFQWNGNRYNGGGKPAGTVSKIAIGVEIVTDSTVQNMIYSLSDKNSFEKLYTSAFLSYPDPRARKMSFYEITGSSWRLVREIKLIPHDFLNIAYYLNHNMLSFVADKDTSVLAPDTSEKVILFEENKIRVSLLNNPMNFSYNNTYQAGNEDILALATNVMNVSDRNFGTYPLYIFTTQGIFTMQVGSGEVVYSSITPTSSIEVPISAVVCPTPYGVAFVGRRGVFMINGDQTALITPQLEMSPAPFNIQTHPNLDGVILNYSVPFVNYIKSIDKIIYNPHENELIIVNNQHSFNYVIAFDTNTIYQSTEKISFEVKNTYPNLIVVNNLNLVDYSLSGSPDTHVSIMLRPLSFGTLDIKKLDRVILRAQLHNLDRVNNKDSVIIVHHSNDNINFEATRGLTIPPPDGQGLRDYDMGLFTRTKYRWYMFAFGAVIDEKSIISFLETNVEKEYDNDKMR